MEQTDVKLKLLIDTKAQRVLYGEADNKFINFLFNLLSLPLGAVIRVLKKEAMVGCLGNLYESIETFNGAYLKQPEQSSETLLKPKVSFNCSTKLLPDIETTAAAAPTYYVCNNTSGYNSSSCRVCLSDGPGANCPHCHSSMRQVGRYVLPPSRSIEGFVNDFATYIVTDDLTVKHISDFSITTLLKRFDIKDVDSLEEKVITLDVNEVHIFHICFW